MGLLGWHRSWRAANGTSLILHEANDSRFSLQAGGPAVAGFCSQALLGEPLRLGNQLPKQKYQESIVSNTLQHRFPIFHRFLIFVIVIVY